MANYVHTNFPAMARIPITVSRSSITSLNSAHHLRFSALSRSRRCDNARIFFPYISTIPSCQNSMFWRTKTASAEKM